jgi:serine/threonine protein kinase
LEEWGEDEAASLFALREVRQFTHFSLPMTDEVSQTCAGAGFNELEAQVFVVQLFSACHYVHTHRDLKLGNFFLDARMNVKVGDKNPGERKKTICGTPNYIAPEALIRHREQPQF